MNSCICYKYTHFNFFNDFVMRMQKKRCIGEEVLF
jgi:hypothetical protein